MGQESRYGPQEHCSSSGEQGITGKDVEAARSHIAVVPTRAATRVTERKHHAPREEVVSIRRGKSGFGMVLREGCYVSHVDAGGQADRSGLPVGSVLRSVNGRAVTTLADAVRLLQQCKHREVAQVGFMPPPRGQMARRSYRGDGTTH